MQTSAYLTNSPPPGEIFESLLDACRRSHGEMTLASHQVEDFEILSKGEGVHHGFNNARQEDGKFFNQVTITDPETGSPLVFSIYTDEPITN